MKQGGQFKIETEFKNVSLVPQAQSWSQCVSSKYGANVAKMHFHIGQIGVKPPNRS